MVNIGYESSGNIYVTSNSFKKLIKPMMPHITMDNSNPCDFIIKSPLSGEVWNKEKKPYLYWSGESRLPVLSNYHTNCLYILTFLYDHPNAIYLPFCLESDHLYKNRIDTNLNREYLVGYCASNFVEIRENIFNIFVEKAGEDMCRSYGACYGKYTSTNHRFDNDHNFQGDSLINMYKKHKFVLALENNNVDGCVTEKIVNAFYSGAIPIYWGSKNISDLFNKDAFINVDDFESLEECVDYVIHLSDEKRQYMLEQPIYTDSEVIHLLDDEYNSTHDNKTLQNYTEKIKLFLSSI